MKKSISVVLAVIMLLSVMVVGTGASAATTTFNGKTAAVGEYVYATYYIQAPELMEDIQAYVSYTSGLKLKSVTYSKKMQNGSFVENHALKNQIKFNSITLVNPMNFKKKTTLVKMKFQVTKAGKQTTSFTLECLDSTTGKHYGKTQKNTLYSKVKLNKSTQTLVYKVKLNKTKLTLKKGRTYKLKATITPSSASKAVKWSSNKKKIVSVSSAGKIKALKKGKAVITCKTKDGSNKSAKCTVTVK